ncbi:MAG: radical SAM family heme chaperone HemW [Bacteroidales bacterium]|nr:radical SAM family heme chaperone HemW [Bacteroidales bacterium]
MIYVHVPFCGSFCIYCDFYSEIARSAGVRDRYVNDICAEATRRQEEIRRSSAVRTLYFGGGTPSVLPLSSLERIVRAVDAGPLDEFTVEVNPEDIVQGGLDYVRGLLDLGVNRVSMGVQSLDEGMLRWMKRRHDAAGARRAFRLLRQAGVENLSVDVIFGISQLTDEVLERTVSELLDWGPEHVSAYQLTIEPKSALGQLYARGAYVPASDGQCSAQYGLLCERLAAAGFRHYEISNWARPGREAIHNSAYWSRAAYVGLGPGAHSFDGQGRRSWNSQTLSGWTAESETLDDAAQRTERIMLGLRTDRGVGRVELPAGAVERLLGSGALTELPGGFIRIPEDHWFVSDAIIADLV